jgi:hypothetical protein
MPRRNNRLVMLVATVLLGAGWEWRALVTTPRELPALQLVNKKEVQLDFEAAKSGFAGVKVWVTRDDGGAWKQLPVIPKVTLRDSRGNRLTGFVTVEIPEDDTVYGFCLVVKTRAGQGKAPQRGDRPQIRVERDTTPPVAELYTPQLDPNRRDSLILSWVATDKNLADKPISLEWAEHKEGPWSFIGPAEQANTGRCIWEISAAVPASVFLRLTVRDKAGNEAVAQTEEPIRIDLDVTKETRCRVKDHPH